MNISKAIVVSKGRKFAPILQFEFVNILSNRIAIIDPLYKYPK